ncbi:hypothetical protein DFJ73DRAFT_857492 [Zopfochytrium polystomum]|nr:hypothetical protein DFJ73DRAFT_857492 [Zopfochytrium polystomum]
MINTHTHTHTCRTAHTVHKSGDFLAADARVGVVKKKKTEKKRAKVANARYKSQEYKKLGPIRRREPPSKREKNEKNRSLNPQHGCSFQPQSSLHLGLLSSAADVVESKAEQHTYGKGNDCAYDHSSDRTRGKRRRGRRHRNNHRGGAATWIVGRDRLGNEDLINVHLTDCRRKPRPRLQSVPIEGDARQVLVVCSRVKVDGVQPVRHVAIGRAARHADVVGAGCQRATRLVQVSAVDGGAGAGVAVKLPGVVAVLDGNQLDDHAFVKLHLEPLPDARSVVGELGRGHPPRGVVGVRVDVAAAEGGGDVDDVGGGARDGRRARAGGGGRRGGDAREGRDVDDGDGHFWAVGRTDGWIGWIGLDGWMRGGFGFVRRLGWVGLGGGPEGNKERRKGREVWVVGSAVVQANARGGGQKREEEERKRGKEE